LAIPVGDPAGIGPEVVLKALGAMPWADQADIVLFGTASLLEQTLKSLHLHSGEISWPQLKDLKLEEVTPPWSLADMNFGQESAATGAASFAYLQAAIEQTVGGNFDAIVTAPIAKSAWKAAGHIYPGQTNCWLKGPALSGLAWPSSRYLPILGGSCALCWRPPTCLCARCPMPSPQR